MFRKKNFGMGIGFGDIKGRREGQLVRGSESPTRDTLTYGVKLSIKLGVDCNIWKLIFVGEEHALRMWVKTAFAGAS
jgi:hypothetical protein